ncbi:hypothetical protein Asera_28220 [Actinocatenispora sera]|uniref:Uncharacterized protein n=1 Tax=Actinocatenispora sera TaxID=390989 RepID=A0A810KZZ8_9ACTN|nr:hypothetical protein Asera_28220 [Actinocatenispora sera]
MNGAGPRGGTDNRREDGDTARAAKPGAVSPCPTHNLEVSVRLLHRIRARLCVLFPGRGKDRPTDPYVAALRVARRRRQAIARALTRDPRGGLTLVPLDRDGRR